MAATVERLTSGDSAEYPQQGEASETVVYAVTLDSPDAYAGDVIGAGIAAGMPGYGDSHPRFGQMTATRFSPRRTDHRNRWEVAVTFSGLATGSAPEFTPQQVEFDPEEDDPPEIEWDCVRREEAARGLDPTAIFTPEDIEDAGGAGSEAVNLYRDDHPILNTAKRPYDPPLTFWKANSVLRYTRSELDFSFESVRPYLFKLNYGEFKGAPDSTVMCQSIRARQVIRRLNGAKVGSVQLRGPVIRYWRVSYEFEFNPDGWQPKVLQQDYVQLTVEGDDHEPILDSDGSATRVPRPINAVGRAIAIADLPGAAVFDTEYVFGRVDFSPLGI